MFPGKEQYTSAPAPAGLHIHRSVHSLNPLNWRKTGLEIRRQKPDMVIVAFWIPLMAMSLGSLARLIRKNGHSRIVGLVHNLIPMRSAPAI